MLVPKSTGPLLLLLSITAHAVNNPVPAVPPPKAAPVAAGPKELPSPSTTLAGGASARSAPPLPIKAPNPAEVNKEPGSVDAPVDGLDGKPHTGPGLFETKEKGTGDVGISGGTLHVDLKKPPLHTGDHEIVGLEDSKEEDESKVRSSVSACDGCELTFACGGNRTSQKKSLMKKLQMERCHPPSPAVLYRIVNTRSIYNPAQIH